MSKVNSIFCTPEDANLRYKSNSSKAHTDGFVYVYAQDENYVKKLATKGSTWLKNNAQEWGEYCGQSLVLYSDKQYNCTGFNQPPEDLYLRYLINKYIKNERGISNRLNKYQLPTPSEEQFAIIEAALKGESLKVQAFAGTGKTTTIKMIAACMDMPSTYVVFNAAARSDAEGNIENALVTTAHSLAYQSTISCNNGFYNKFQDSEKTWFLSEIKKHFPQLTDIQLGYITRTVKRFIKAADEKVSNEHIHENDVATIKLKSEPASKKAIRLVTFFAQQLKDFEDSVLLSELVAIQKSIKSDKGIKKVNDYIAERLSQNELTELIKETISNYKHYSDTDEITEEDFPNNKHYKKLVDDSEEKSHLIFEDLLKGIVKSAQTLWNEISSPDSELPLDHDCYLKIWQLSKPKIDTPVIFIDESQDLDPVMLSVLMEQRAQKVWVGDRYQQIYAWRGAVNAMEQLDDCKQYLLTETYRFPGRVSNIANRVLSKLGETNTIKSKISANKKPANSKAFIARYNRTLLEEALDLARNQKKFYFKGFDGQKLYNHSRSIIELYNRQRPFMDIYAAFTSVAELEEFLEEEQNDNMRKALSFCSNANFDLRIVRSKLDSISSYNTPDANLVLITAHQSKGLEWDEVVLASDFEDAILKERNGTTEWNLLYVALTRTKQYIRTFSNLIAFLLPKSEELFPPQSVEVSESIQIPEEDSSELFYDERSRELYKHFLIANSELPEIGFELYANNGEIVGELEFAWPQKKLGVYLDEKPSNIEGWTFYSVEFALDNLTLFNNERLAV